jgi:hypothetical protein
VRREAVSGWGLQMIERHQDYILSIPSLAPGASVLANPLVLDQDAPFLLRQRGIHVVPVAPGRSQVDALELSFRYKNATGDYLADAPIQTPTDFQMAFGQNGLYRPVYPQQPYPPGGVIETDLINNSGDTLTNTQLIFRGVKLFPDGSLSAPTYPRNCECRDFTYQTGKGTNTDPAIVLNPSGNGSQLYQVPLSILNDADFVLRGLQAGNWDESGDGGLYSTAGYTELYVQLFDAQLKPYSNMPIHINWLFGNAGGQTGAGQFTALGNATPGLLFPEIYIPRNSNLYFNIQRQDAPWNSISTLPVRIIMQWIGSKVYPR